MRTFHAESLDALYARTRELVLDDSFLAHDVPFEIHFKDGDDDVRMRVRRHVYPHKVSSSKGLDELARRLDNALTAIREQQLTPECMSGHRYTECEFADRDFVHFAMHRRTPAFYAEIKKANPNWQPAGLGTKGE